MFAWCPFKIRRLLPGACLLLFFCPGVSASPDTNSPSGNTVFTRTDAVVLARSNFLKARVRYQAETNNPEAAWHFARACFDAAEFALNNTERAEIAELGIAASRRSLTQSNSAPARYYLGMNLGRLAETKGLSALRLVNEMERQFLLTRELDERFDFAGADRNLGLLYLQAPSLGSIGDRGKARHHARRAVELAPEFPENRLNLIDVYLKSSDRNAALRELKELEKIWPEARKQLTGAAWVTSWTSWAQRLKTIKQKLGEPSKTLESPRHKSSDTPSGTPEF